ncbi:MAG: hypothetical protein MOB07_19445 [Acidobacteria bacterium]|nr:hypothetical protein [Acidobacteriota bacterium]
MNNFPRFGGALIGARQGYFRDDDILAFRESAASCAQVAAWLPFNVNVKVDPMVALRCE